MYVLKGYQINCVGSRTRKDSELELLEFKCSLPAFRFNEHACETTNVDLLYASSCHFLPLAHSISFFRCRG